MPYRIAERRLLKFPPPLVQNRPACGITIANPMTGVVKGFRWALFGTNTAPGAIICASSLIAVSVLVSGALYFSPYGENLRGCRAGELPAAKVALIMEYLFCPKG